jgi:hypothetical protein
MMKIKFKREKIFKIKSVFCLIMVININPKKWLNLLSHLFKREEYL